MHVFIFARNEGKFPHCEIFHVYSIKHIAKGELNDEMAKLLWGLSDLAPALEIELEEAMNEIAHHHAYEVHLLIYYMKRNLHYITRFISAIHEPYF